MASDVLAAVVLNHVSGLARDEVVNNFVFHTPTTPPSTTELDNIRDALVSFYNDVASGASASMGTYIGQSISRSTLPNIKFYLLDGHLNGSAHGSPIRIDTFPSFDSPGGSDDMPAEVAFCLSFHAPFFSDPEFSGSTRPRSRDRGRIYLGPLIRSTASTSSTTHITRPHTTFQADVLFAGAALRDDTDSNWCVWSRVGGMVQTITTVMVDDAFDTQRRRGERPSAVTTA
jgi:hypothetical protein